MGIHGLLQGYLPFIIIIFLLLRIEWKDNIKINFRDSGVEFGFGGAKSSISPV
jgi:hypothetical protein